MHSSSEIVFFVVGIPVFESVPALSPLYDLIIKSQFSDEDGSTTPTSARFMRFYAVSSDCVMRMEDLLQMCLTENDLTSTDSL